MNRHAAAIAFAALLPLAGCATPYGGSRGAWAHYDKNYAYGQEGYDRPITYAGVGYGEAAFDHPPGDHPPGDHPSGNSSDSGQAFYYAQPLPDYAGEAERFARRTNRCNCIEPQNESDHAGKAEQDSSWTSTYYAIGP